MRWLCDVNAHSNTAEDYKNARELRNNATPSEKKLWVVLRDYAAQHELKFRRQHSVHPYIADFACLEARLLIELDGFSHDLQSDYDIEHTKKLELMGFTVLRFSNQDIEQNVEGVAMTIVLSAKNLIQACANGLEMNTPLP